MDREKTVCFTGHRTVPDAERAALLSNLYSTVCRLILSGHDSFICGGALGFDTLAAECVIGLREKFPGIRLTLALPCRDQTVKWDDLDALARYKRILGEADDVHYIRDFYTDGCMHERNRWMVDNSCVCIAYLTGGRGGTKYTVSYAKKQGLTLINLAERDEDQLSFF